MQSVAEPGSLCNDPHYSYLHRDTSAVCMDAGTMHISMDVVSVHDTIKKVTYIHVHKSLTTEVHM